MIQLREHQTETLNRLSEYNKGQVIVPTGGGKTMCMIKDAIREFDSGFKTIVVVAPRILLANQLSSEFLEVIREKYRYVQVMHVHSGETHHFSTTSPVKIAEWSRFSKGNKIIFTTYHSLHRIKQSDAHIDTIYFDEAHNSVQRNFYPATEHFATRDNSRCFFFTATPKHSTTIEKPGMNNEKVYGKVIINVPAPKLVKEGHILPPKVIIKKIDVPDDSRFSYEKDCDHVISTIDDVDTDKILICARSTKQIVNLVAQSKLVDELSWRGYSWMYITAKTGGIIDGEKVSREEFFDVLNVWGQDDTKRFVVLHHSILSEGINVRGLEAALFLRNMDYISISQTIGRVIRKGRESKTYGLVVVPCYDKVGISTSRKVEAVVDTVFNKGEPAISTIRR
jgi:superfamily II DNA or RNA helicase